MRKNQKYTQTEMFSAIERCRKEKIQYSKFCKESGIPYASLKYWIDKYNLEQIKRNKPEASFVPVRVPDVPSGHTESPENIMIAYPNGIKVSCPVSVTPVLLRTFLKP